jgi:hypothetical protein
MLNESTSFNPRFSSWVNDLDMISKFVVMQT